MASTPEQKLLKKEREKALKKYKKTEIVDLLCGVTDLPRQKVSEIFVAFCDLLVEMSFTESVVHIPRFGKFIFEPKSIRKIWNPKEKKSLFYQNPRVTFKMSFKLRSLLRKEYRRNCYQLVNLNPNQDFKPPKEWKKEEVKQEIK